MLGRPGKRRGWADVTQKHDRYGILSSLAIVATGGTTRRPTRACQAKVG